VPRPSHIGADRTRAGLSPSARGQPPSSHRPSRAPITFNTTAYDRQVHPGRLRFQARTACQGVQPSLAWPLTLTFNVRIGIRRMSTEDGSSSSRHPRSPVLRTLRPVRCTAMRLPSHPAAPTTCCRRAGSLSGPPSPQRGWIDFDHGTSENNRKPSSTGSRRRQKQLSLRRPNGTG
jgi:hypothetical protein